MPRRKADETAAELLGRWTDSDTAMQIVGTSLGVFGVGRLDPEVVLARETPLRNALFDVLLSLVEGGALDVRPTDDGRYAFRWRADYAVGALTSEMVTTVDIDVPSPYLAELSQVRGERDAAVARAATAEARTSERTDRDAAVRPEIVEEPAPAFIDLVALADEDDEYDEYDDFDEDPDDAEPANGAVVYLPPSSSPDAPARRSKWSPYTLDKTRSHLSGAERIANQG
jgi:hypothetical protein